MLSYELHCCTSGSAPPLWIEISLPSVTDLDTTVSTIRERDKKNAKYYGGDYFIEAVMKLTQGGYLVFLAYSVTLKKIFVKKFCGLQISAKRGPDSTFAVKANTKTLCPKSSLL